MIGVNIGTVILIGVFFTLISFATMALCFFAIGRWRAALKKIKDISEYCKERFDKIDERVEEDNRHRTELTNLIKELNLNLKNIQD